MDTYELLAAPVMLELEERDSTLLGTITGGSVELLECLVEEAQGSSADARNNKDKSNSMEPNSHTDHSNNTDQSSNEQSSHTDQSSNEQSSSVDVKSSTIDKTSGSSDRKAVYVELLKFMREDGEQTDPIPKHPITQQPDVKIRLKHCKKSSRSSTANSVELAVQLEQCWSEVDISIMDRISALLNPKPLCSISSQYKADNTMQSAFDQAIETCSECDSKLEWKVTSSYVVIKLRFPIPDLRPVHDMARPPWWCYRLHPDIAWLNLTDIALRSHLTSRQPALSFEISCQSALASFQEGGTGVSVPFGYTTFDDSGDYIQDVGWPRLVIRVYSSLNYDLEDPLEEPQCMTHSIIEPPLRELFYSILTDL
ncbi:hypothetical protein M8J77_018961 [Diaphorina citri]|nr:hypothetical protein M8J77_018961 [Diaphorina citri]